MTDRQRIQQLRIIVEKLLNQLPNNIGVRKNEFKEQLDFLRLNHPDFGEKEDENSK